MKGWGPKSSVGPSKPRETNFLVGSPGNFCRDSLGAPLSAAFYAAYGFTGAFGRNLCKFTFPQRRRNLRKSLLFATRPTGVKRAKKWLR